MCGRFWLSGSGSGTNQLLKFEKFEYQGTESFNIAPGQWVHVVINDKGVKSIEMKWGLLPAWAKTSTSTYKMINARAESITEKRTYKNLLKQHRCLIPCSGFYEWKVADGKKRPYCIRMKNKKIFTMAGLWTTWHGAGRDIKSFTIITIEANELMASIHHRMPVIIPEDRREWWLDRNNQDTDALLSLLKPYPSKDMELYEIGTYVNVPEHNDAQCILPLE